MPPRAGSSTSPLALGAKWCDAHASRASRSSLAAQVACAFSTTSCQSRRSLAQQDFHQWQKNRGFQFRDPPIHGPNYLGQFPDQPFPMNPFFRSQPVLGEEMREQIYMRVTVEKHSLKAISYDLGVDVRRIAAVVRMKEIEKQWTAEGKKLAKPYARAILRMLPQTEYRGGKQGEKFPHEPINEVHVHKSTMRQLFVPVAESRHFTRQDAAKAFHKDLLAVDDRSPHTELIKLTKDVVQKGVSEADAMRKFRETTRAAEDRLIEREQQRLAKAEEETTRVDTGRFEFRFKEMNVEHAGKDGRGRRAVGWRYGVPLNDRKKGACKIPTSVP